MSDVRSLSIASDFRWVSIAQTIVGLYGYDKQVQIQVLALGGMLNIGESSWEPLFGFQWNKVKSWYGVGEDTSIIFPTKSALDKSGVF